jgi:hypothetical protein
MTLTGLTDIETGHLFKFFNFIGSPLLYVRGGMGFLIAA